MTIIIIIRSMMDSSNRIVIFLGGYIVLICELKNVNVVVCRFIILVIMIGRIIRCGFLFSIIGSLELSLTKYENIIIMPPT